MSMAGKKRQRRLQNIVVILLNVVLIFCLVIGFMLYDRSYRQKLYNQNLNDISNVNQAAANIASSFFSGQETKLRDLALYIESNSLTLAEGMEYINSSNSDSSRVFELIGADCCGWVVQKNAAGEYKALDYRSGYNDICLVFQSNSRKGDSETVTFLPEFTDAHSAMKSFALYNCVHLRDENGEAAPYTLMIVSQTANFIRYINIDSGYDTLATVLINQKGDYIIGSSSFKSTNLFKHLALFNDLTLDQQKAVEAEVDANQKGTLAYLDARSRSSVYVYTPVPQKPWYCVTAVPLENFRDSDSEFSFTITVTAIMLALLAVDLLYLATLNRRLRISAENERVASAAKTDFLSRMSHDMRTPMNGIIGMTRLTEDLPGLPAEARDNLAAIRDSSTYLLQLINDTLDMSKIENSKVTLHPEPFQAKDLMDHIMSAIHPLAEQKHIRMELVPLGEDIGCVRADRMRLQQIFLNILSNAVKFTPEHGLIRTELACMSREGGYAHCRARVTDNGCGMSEEFLRHIYEPFSQEHTRITAGQEGTGLGMAIVKNLVELMGGRVEIASRLGEGTTVSIFLDLELVETEQLPAETKNAPAARLEGRRVLLAEDHPLNATIATRLLQKRGMQVEHAENGRKAIEMFAASAEHYYDAVLMDIRMPECTGLEATRAIRLLDRSDAATVPILAMTANAYAEDVQSALAAGMNAHLAKPIQPETLYAALEQYL